MSTLEKAISIAVKYHRNQRDSEGTPRIVHSLSVMFNMKTEEEMIVAILHDVVEDTEYNLTRLKKDGFSTEILTAIDYITHRKKESYEDYIDRVKINSLALRVKHSDLTHNMDIKRMNNISNEQMITYINKYKFTWNKLKVLNPDTLVNKSKLNFKTKYNLNTISTYAYKYMKRMIKVNNLEKAISIAVKAHENQKDKSGTPYILHPLHVMMKMKTEEEKIVGVLHDVVEDTAYTLESLKNEGFSYEIIEAIDCLTKRKDEDYLNYINKVASNTIATKVKIQDLEHNMDLKRLNDIKEEDILRIVNNYKPAWDKLKVLVI
ncbi:hypothetical protein [Clostridium sp.]|uniref:hypothetical protein n=1 Tax=Clostridium sp. TaxID=1506 RepID=UPI0032170823